jgi:hypothetical protein
MEEIKEIGYDLIEFYELLAEPDGLGLGSDTI